MASLSATSRLSAQVYSRCALMSLMTMWWSLAYASSNDSTNTAGAGGSVAGAIGTDTGGGGSAGNGAAAGSGGKAGNGGSGGKAGSGGKTGGGSSSGGRAGASGNSGQG